MMRRIVEEKNRKVFVLVRIDITHKCTISKYIFSLFLISRTKKC